VFPLAKGAVIDGFFVFDGRESVAIPAKNLLTKFQPADTLYRKAVVPGAAGMELREALTQIDEIRRRVAETELFHGYRALPVAFSGVLAIVAAAAQPALVPDPLSDVPAYLKLWVSVAALSAGVNGLSLLIRYRVSDNSAGRDGIRLAVGQFAPCVLAGALLTAALVHGSGNAALLPGLWQVLFSLGLFASCRLMPRATVAIAAFYLTAGIACLLLSRGEYALSPWMMGVPFGVGQFATAAMLYWNFERRHEPIE